MHVPPDEYVPVACVRGSLRDFSALDINVLGARALHPDRHAFDGTAKPSAGPRSDHIACVTSRARRTILDAMNDYFPSGASAKFGAFDEKANVAPPPTFSQPWTAQGDRYDSGPDRPVAPVRPNAIVGAVLQSDGSVALTWRRTPYNDPPGMTVTFITATQLQAYCNTSSAATRSWMLYSLWLREAVAADRGAIQRDLDAMCNERQTVQRYLNVLGRSYPRLIPAGQSAPPPPDTGLPDWAKYLIGGVIGIGAGYGIFALTSAEPRANGRRR